MSRNALNIRFKKPAESPLLYKCQLVHPQRKQFETLSWAPLEKYMRILSLTRIQFNKYMDGAGRRQCPKPSGTGKGISRHQRATISGGKRRVTNVNVAVGGARGYHDRPSKKVYKLNKKEHNRSIALLFLKACLYQHTYWVQTLPEYKLLRQQTELKTAIPRIGVKQDRTYSKYRKACVIVHDEDSVYKAYRNIPGFQTVNVKIGQNYRSLQLYLNSRHVIIITEPAMLTIRKRYLDAL